MTTENPTGFRKPCAEYAACRHAKHGYTRRDRPAPSYYGERRRGPSEFFRSSEGAPVTATSRIGNRPVAA